MKSSEANNLAAMSAILAIKKRGLNLCRRKKPCSLRVVAILHGQESPLEPSVTNHEDRVTCAALLVLPNKRTGLWLGSRYFFFYFFKLLAAICNIIISLKHVCSLLNLNKRGKCQSMREQIVNWSVVKRKSHCSLQRSFFLLQRLLGFEEK